MPARGGGGGGAAPSQPELPGNQAAPADGATGQIITTLVWPTDVGYRNVLDQAVVRILEDVSQSTLPSSTGPLWAELWLTRSSGMQILLDSGFIRGGGARGKHSVIGMIGHVSYRRGDQLIALLANDSGGTLTAELEYATSTVEEDEILDESFRPLSTEREATFVFHAEVSSDDAGGALITATLTPNAGDSLRIEQGVAYHDNGAAAAVIVQIDDGTEILYGLTSAAGTSAAAGVYIGLPVVAGSGVGQFEENPTVPSTGRLYVSVATTAANKLLKLGLVARISGRKPAFASTVSAGTKTQTVDVSKVV